MSQPIALVTGANRGIGHEVAKALAQKGYHVLLCARKLAAAEQAAAALQAEIAGSKVSAYAVDVSDSESVHALAAKLSADFPQLDVLVNNAGGYYDMGVSGLDQTEAVMLQTLNTNFLGAWRMIQALRPLLIKSAHGRVVNVSSVGGTMAGIQEQGDDILAYAASKSALNILTIKAALALKPHNVLVNSVCPGYTATEPGSEAWGARPVPEGAAGIVWAATLPDDGPTGGFFRDGKPISF